MVVRRVSGVTYDELGRLSCPTVPCAAARCWRSTATTPWFSSLSPPRASTWPSQGALPGPPPLQLGVSGDMLGRVFNGMGKPIDGGPEILAEEYRDINGLPMNPAARDYPNEFIQTGISTIDGLNTLVRGQKLPIFSGSGLPHAALAAQIARQARVLGDDAGNFAVVLCRHRHHLRGVRLLRAGVPPHRRHRPDGALHQPGQRPGGGTHRHPPHGPHRRRVPGLREGHARAGHHDRHHQLRRGPARGVRRQKEVPGRRGYGYLYTNLATLYERAGRQLGKSGSITLIPILTMPEDDKTHPIPDLTGYITEGQIILSRELYRKGVIPPVDVLPSLSRLKDKGVGPGKTREDHAGTMNQLFAAYSTGKENKELMSILGEAALSPPTSSTPSSLTSSKALRGPGQRREPLHRGDSGSGLGAAEHPAQGGAQAHQAGVH